MILRSVDLETLRAFVTLVDSGSFTRAARQLHRSQSTLSQQIKRLEDLLTVRLLERSTRTLNLTQEGQRVLEVARKMLGLNDELLATADSAKLKGIVRLGTPEDFATAHLARVLADFATAYPDVALEVTCDLTRNLEIAFADNRFDLVLLKRHPETAQAAPAVWREPLVWVANGPWKRPDPVPLIVSPEPCVYRARAVAALREAGREYRVAYISPSLAGTRAAVEAQLGVTVLPRDIVPRGFQTLGHAQGFPKLADTEIALISRPDGISPPARRLASFIRERLEGTAA